MVPLVILVYVCISMLRLYVCVWTLQLLLTMPGWPQGREQKP